MAESDLSGYLGAVTMPSTHGGQAKGFTVRRTMSTKNTGRYAAGSRAEQSRGGSIGIGGDINVFLRAGASGTNPNFIAPAADGSALTLQLFTGCTLAGTALFPDLSVTHNFEDPAIEGTHAYRFTGPVTEVWAVA